jgi:hypothetical protein
LSFGNKGHQLECVRKPTANQPDPTPIGFCAWYALLPFNTDESGIRQFVLTVAENMLSGVGRAAYLNCSQNTRPGYLEYIKPDGPYWKVL